MKNNKGISLITLLITVIVLIILVSITTFNGVNMINDARKKDAEDKLRIICGAILKDDTFLSFSGNTEITLNESDFDYMDLLKYYNEEQKITVKKSEILSENTKKILYTLNLKDLESGNDYTYDFDYSLYGSKYNYDISFNENKGVNRPIIVEGMTPLMPDGATEVKDIYTSNWYNYEKGLVNFAKMKYQDKIYVWIPRFAYDIQNFYEGRKQNQIPTSAINIVFLRETSSYMTNDEVLEGEYKVHPAFINDDVQYSGIWVEQNSIVTSSLPTSPLYEQVDNGSLHMMTNMECGAMIYLVSALDAMNQITLEEDEYVAASTGDFGVFAGSEGFATLYTLGETGNVNTSGIYGDALSETPWNRNIENYPTVLNKYIIRKFSEGIYDFTNSNGADSATYRGVITIK